MKIFPAIDIKNKKCVRLVKGDFNQIIGSDDDGFEISIEGINTATFQEELQRVQLQASSPTVLNLRPCPFSI